MSTPRKTPGGHYFYPFVRAAVEACRRGEAQRHVAARLGITQGTLRLWCVRFGVTFKRGRRPRAKTT